MKFVSTRGQTEPHSFSEAVKVGLAPDGGLFVPESLPDLSGELSSWVGKSYPEMCAAFFRHFATDIPEDELKELIDNAYSRFDHEAHAPLVKLDDKIDVLELFHGPTLAFKDFALQLLGKFYERQVALSEESINVLGATSGDTGAAAISGLLGKPGVNIFILYPDGRVSPLQERQMTCTGASNVYPLCVTGSFDDAQAALKEVFGDRAYSQSMNLSAVNSINLARILAQCVYYLYAWLQLPEATREKTTFVVPTGNFGNVLAGWMASQMGMKVAGFRVATNQNDILDRFFSSGEYSVGDVEPSLAPSMDIQIASNFERFLYYTTGEDAAKTRETMSEIKERKAFSCEDPKVLRSMSSSRMSDTEIRETISSVYERFGYVVDPHTACGFKDLESLEHCVILSTAHPAKFPDVVEEALGQTSTHPELDALKTRDIIKFPLSPEANSIKEFIASKQ
jgi:threonine synthase